jgi:uncharacterized protein (DUF302 family)
MKTLWLVLIGSAIAAASATAAENGIVTKASTYSVAETLARLEKVLTAKGMTVFARIDHRAEAERSGLAMRSAQLLVFGNPKGGTPLMVAAPTAALDLPLKTLVWEDAGGKVWLSYNTLAYVAQRHEIRGKDDLIRNLDGALNAMSDEALK